MLCRAAAPAPSPHIPLAAVQYPELQSGAYGSRQSRNPSHITTPTAAWKEHWLPVSKQTVISATPSAAVG